MVVVSHLQAALSRIVRSRSRLPASPYAPPLVFPHRLLPSSAASSSDSFSVKDYLVSRCGLTQAQALKAAARLSHLRSRAKPEAVLTYLESTLGVPAADVGRAVVIDPNFLCSNVERTLAPRVAELRGLGLSQDEIARLVPLAPNSFRSKFLRGNVEFWLAQFGSFDTLLHVLRWSSGLLTMNLDKTARPNVAFLRQCGLDISKVACTTLFSTRLFTMNLEAFKETVQRVEELGIDCGARTFRQALAIFALTGKEVVSRRIQLLLSVGFSKDDVLAMVRKQPRVLGMSEKKLQGNMDFLVRDVGLELPYIVRRPALLMYSVERRLLPRHSLLKVLKAKELLKNDLDYYFTASLGEKIFVEKFVHGFEKQVPGLIDDHASKCLGKVTNGIA
ncbi:hypothetical protein GQ55_2G435000 [Panicum hallii var. hallii]|uniref:Uncharacterized protein n=1 Tax=Panicum hallii var. hallii TaxID=1504633 RepID=A0A2T7EYM7_9POAL|nr:hypothetical protein GQ55_2G435000 [Panicum hallii var. hallii]PUZ72934.1 hypothetical protein GQ55_2G435000 [Panicum hallii var. hallii]